jgi:hypothetical protein
MCYKIISNKRLLQKVETIRVINGRSPRRSIGVNFLLSKTASPPVDSGLGREQPQRVHHFGGSKPSNGLVAIKKRLLRFMGLSTGNCTQ